MATIILSAKRQLLAFGMIILIVILNIGITFGNAWEMAFADIEPGDLTPHKITVKWVGIGLQCALTWSALLVKLEKKVVAGKSPLEMDETTMITRTKTQTDSVRTDVPKSE